MELGRQNPELSRVGPSASFCSHRKFLTQGTCPPSPNPISHQDTEMSQPPSLSNPPRPQPARGSPLRAADIEPGASSGGAQGHTRPWGKSLEKQSDWNQILGDEEEGAKWRKWARSVQAGGKASAKTQRHETVTTDLITITIGLSGMSLYHDPPLTAL